MRGYNVSILSKPDTWWAQFLETSYSLNNNIFLERLFFGGEESVLLHLLVPTQFGMLINKQRNNLIYRAIKKFVKLLAITEKEKDVIISILLAQESIMVGCAFCGLICKKDETKCYQVVARFIISKIKSTYEHLILLNIICRKCQTTSWHSLLKIDNSVYGMLCDQLDNLQLKNEIGNGVVLGPEFIKRFSVLNCFVPEIISKCIDKVCYHCGKHQNTIKLCKKCKCVWFCSNGESGDKRFGYEKKTCRELSFLYHDNWLCEKLSSEYLFRILESIYVMSDTLTSAIDFRKSE
jgi:hypothetical protein